MVISGESGLEARQVLMQPGRAAAAGATAPARVSPSSRGGAGVFVRQAAALARRVARNESEKHSSSPSPLAMKAGTAASTILTEPHT